jgi:RNA polymerase sigma factor (sigma-70 family)
MVESDSQTLTHEGGDPSDSARRARTRRPLKAVDDSALVGLARRGSQIAWDELVQRFGRLILAVARRHRLSPADSADVAQVTWMQLYRHLDDLRQPERVASWLATTARHECLRIVTSGREQPAGPSDVEDWPVPGSDPLDEVLLTERRALVHGAMDKIPEGSRRFLELLVWEERSYQEISDATGMAVGSIGPTRERVLRRLARKPEIAGLADGAPAA